MGSAAEAFQILAENSTDAIDRVDRENRHLYVNAAFAKLVALSPEAIVGRTNRELGVPDPFARIWEERVLSVFESGRSLRIEDAFPTPNGVRPVEARCDAERGPDGSVTSVVAIYRDMTDRRLTDEALRESEERLRF